MTFDVYSGVLVFRVSGVSIFLKSLNSNVLILLLMLGLQCSLSIKCVQGSMLINVLPLVSYVISVLRTLVSNVKYLQCLVFRNYRV